MWLIRIIKYLHKKRNLQCLTIQTPTAADNIYSNYTDPSGVLPMAPSSNTAVSPVTSFLELEIIKTHEKLKCVSLMMNTHFSQVPHRYKTSIYLAVPTNF